MSMSPAEANTLVKKNQTDVIQKIEDLRNVPGDESHGESALMMIAEAELARDKPRSGVLKACGYDPAKAEGNGKAEVVETLDPGKPFSMVFCGELKHYFQGGKVYDRATKELRADLK